MACEARGLIAMKPQHYPILPGVLYGGEYPGDRSVKVAKKRLWSLVEMGVRTFIDLTSPDDDLARYEKMLYELEQEAGAKLRHISLPVPDMSVPDSSETMRAILDAIRISVVKRPAVYLHCWGGIGRTGTVAGCWLRECGLGPDEALQRVQKLYATHMPKVRFHPEAPQTEEQRNYIRNWQVRP
jgi:protein-tyrosine phosphatase